MHRIHYYLTGHTSKGLVNLLAETQLHGIKQVFRLDHPSRTVRTAVLSSLLDRYPEESAEIILSPDGDTFLEGIVLRGQGFAALSPELASHAGEGTKLVSQDLSSLLSLTSPQDPEPEDWTSLVTQAHKAFSKGLRVHDELEAIYIQEMDFGLADSFARKLSAELLQDSSFEGRQAVISRRFFGTNTPEGTVNSVPELLRRVSRADFIKGRAGSGKSTLMRRIANVAAEKGLDLEIYHCSFDPGSIDMVLIPELDYCIFDATPPHEFFPEQGTPGHRTIDTYQLFISTGTDERYEREIADATKRYKTYMKEGLAYLQQAGEQIGAYEAFWQRELEQKSTKINQAAEAITGSLQV